MGGGQPQPRQAPQQPANPFDNPFGKVLQDMFGGGAAQQQQPQPRQQAPQNPYGDNPLGKIFEEMLRRRPGAAPSRNPSRRRSRAPTRPAAPAIPMTICSARCSRPAPSSATNTRRAWN